MSYEFVVITKIPTPPETGNMATALGRLFHHDTGRPVDALTALVMSIPVFELGEIVICDSFTGREIDGMQRKPSKWFIEYEEFSNLDEAIHRAKIVMENA